MGQRQVMLKSEMDQIFNGLFGCLGVTDLIQTKRKVIIHAFVPPWERYKEEITRYYSAICMENPITFSQ